jgi:AcrR family transcriptional regulator
MAQERKYQLDRDKRQQIIEAALFVIKSAERSSFSMRRIADHVKCSGPLIYSYFRDKGDLINELKKVALRELAKSIEKIYDQSLSAPEQLKRIYKVYWKFGLEEQPLIRLLFESRFEDEEFSGQEHFFDAVTFNLTAGIFNGLSELNGQNKSSCQSAHFRYWALINGLMEMNLYVEKLPEEINMKILENSISTLYPEFPSEVFNT